MNNYRLVYNLKNYLGNPEEHQEWFDDWADVIIFIRSIKEWDTYIDHKLYKVTQEEIDV